MKQLSLLESMQEARSLAGVMRRS